MQIQNSTPSDQATIFELYELATAVQRSKSPAVVVWPTFEQALVATEIAEGRQWKMVIDGQIACVWATTFSDPEIWEEKNVDPAVYIHRIATNPAFKGQKFVDNIVSWAREHAQANGKAYIRMDTCGNNQGLIKYYTARGFAFLGIHKLKSSKGLPAHYQDADVCFFEIKL